VADAGVKGRRYSDDFTAGSDDQTVIGPFGQIGLQWPWEDGSQLTVSGFADTDNSTTANAQSVLGLRGDVTYRLRDRLSLLAGAEAVRTADLKTTVDESRVTLKATAGLQYALRDGIALRGLARGTTSSADVGEDYDRVELLGDIAVVF
jgi:opacity protein-like surface antigen